MRKTVISKILLFVFWVLIWWVNQSLAQCSSEECCETAWWFVYQEEDQYFVNINDEIYGPYILADKLQVNGTSWWFVYQEDGQYFIKINGQDFGPFTEPVDNFLTNSDFEDLFTKKEVEEDLTSLNNRDIEIDIYNLPIEYLLKKGEGYVIRGYPRLIEKELGLDELAQAEIIPISEVTNLRNYDIVLALNDSEIVMSGLKDIMEMFKVKINSRSIMQYVVLKGEETESFQYEHDSQEVKVKGFYSWLFSKQLEQLETQGEYLKVKYLESEEEQIWYKFKASQADKYLSFRQIPFGLNITLNVQKESSLLASNYLPVDVLALSVEEVNKFVQDKSEYLKSIMNVWFVAQAETCLQEETNLSGSIYYYFRDQEQDDIFLQTETNQLIAAVRWTEFGICVGEEATKIKVLESEVEVTLVNDETVSEIIETNFETTITEESENIETERIEEEFYQSAGYQSIEEDLSLSLLSDTTISKWQESIDFLIEEGLIEGYEDGTFKGLQDISRAEAVKLIILSKYSEEEVSNFEEDFCFPDFKKLEWYNRYICFAKDKEIVKGYGDGFFRPTNQVRLVEVLKILMETYDYEIVSEAQSGAWYERYVETAKAHGIVPTELENNVVDNVNREEMAEVITRTIKTSN